MTTTTYQTPTPFHSLGECPLCLMPDGDTCDCMSGEGVSRASEPADKPPTATNKIVRSLSIGARPGFNLFAMVAKYNAACAADEATVTPQQHTRELARMESGYDHARLTGYEYPR